MQHKAYKTVVINILLTIAVLLLLQTRTSAVSYSASDPETALLRSFCAILQLLQGPIAKIIVVGIISVMAIKGFLGQIQMATLLMFILFAAVLLNANSVAQIIVDGSVFNCDEIMTEPDAASAA